MYLLSDRLRGRRLSTGDLRTQRRAGAALIWVLSALAIVAVGSIWLLRSADRAAPLPPPKLASGPPTAQRPTPAPRPVTVVASPTKPKEQKPAPTPDASGVKKSSSNLLATLSAADIERQLVGRWSSYYQGDRRLHVRDDGTGTMVAHPEGLAATLLAAKLKFDLRWKLKGHQVEFETLGGDPIAKVNVVVKMYGRRRLHKLIGMRKDQLELLDEDGVTKYLWKRLPADEETESLATGSKSPDAAPR